jgi:thiol-disulfide isomerase/thioredoxin
LKKHFLVVILLIFTTAAAKASLQDTGKVPLPVITYKALDSLIRSNEFTAVYYWPSWCGACYGNLPTFFDLMRQKRSITLISINDPNSKPVASKLLLRNTDVVKGYFQIERHGREKLIMVNDRGQQRYFNRYYTPGASKTEAELIRRFLLFDRNGKLLYSNSTDYLDSMADSLGIALAHYH